MHSHGGYIVKTFIIVLSFISASWYLSAAEAPDLSQSIVVATNKAIIDSCQQIIEGAKKQQQIVLEYMVTKANISPIFWPIYAKHLFKQSYITPEDLLWLMYEQEKPYHLSKGDADNLFKVIILDNLNPPNKEIRLNKKGIRSNDKESKTYKIIRLLTTPALKNKEFLAPEYHKMCGYMYANEQKAALIIAADEGLNKVITAILSNWQKAELKHLDEIMCTREERNDKAARRYLDPYVYDHKIYTLAKWILRDDGIYLYGKYANNSYITIAKEILQKYKGSNYKLDVPTFKLSLILHKNNDLPEGIDLSLLINKLQSPEGILAKDVNDLEISLIQKRFPYFLPKL